MNANRGLKKDSVVYESDQSLNETESNFPQQPSSGETMGYKIKKA